MAVRCSCFFHVLNNFKSSSKLLKTNIITRIIQTHHIYFSTEVKVPDDVLKSKIDKFSGEKIKEFDDVEVQTLLKKLTGADKDIIFKPRNEELDAPVYKVLDKDELLKEEENFEKMVEKRLEMPEIRKMRRPINVVISTDAELINHDEDDADYVFTDISTSKDERTRAILVRENATGVLREATWDERDRMQYMYWPRENQHHELPPMLEEDHLHHSFSELKHEQLLDYVIIQCEADSPDYIRVHERVYEDLNKRGLYDVLHSTRHYSGMVFYFAFKKNIRNLLSYLLRNGRLENAVDLVTLFRHLHPGSQFAKISKDLKEVDLVQFRCIVASNHSPHPSYNNEIITSSESKRGKTFLESNKMTAEMKYLKDKNDQSEQLDQL